MNADGLKLVLLCGSGLVYWYHNGVMLDYEGPVAILTQEGPEGTRSSLTIGRAAPVHSGNYTC